jgi:predicted transcriptional regulator
MAVSLRIPEKTKRRVEKLARKRDTTAHAFMIAAIEERLIAEETRAAFEFRKTGKGIPAEEVFNYLRKRVQGKPATRPKTLKLA